MSSVRQPDVQPLKKSYLSISLPLPRISHNADFTCFIISILSGCSEIGEGNIGTYLKLRAYKENEKDNQMSKSINCVSV